MGSVDGPIMAGRRTVNRGIGEEQVEDGRTRIWARGDPLVRGTVVERAVFETVRREFQISRDRHDTPGA